MAIGKKQSIPLKGRKINPPRTKRLQGADLMEAKLNKKKPLNRNFSGLKKSRKVKYSYRIDNNNFKKLKNAKHIVYMGWTSEDAGHKHRFILYSDSSVLIKTAVHPEERRIKHNHIYTGKYDIGYISQNQSSCEGGKRTCYEIYGVEGAPLHDHKLIIEDDIYSNLKETKSLNNLLKTLPSKIKSLLIENENKLVTIIKNYDDVNNKTERYTIPYRTSQLLLMQGVDMDSGATQSNIIDACKASQPISTTINLVLKSINNSSKQFITIDNLIENKNTLKGMYQVILSLIISLIIKHK